MVVPRIIGGVVYVASTVAWGWLSLIAAALRCDESCTTNGGWKNDADAWQWSAIGWLGAAGLALALLAVILSVVRRPLAVPVLAAHVLVFLASLLIAATGFATALVVLPLATVGVTAGYAAVAAPPRRRVTH